MKKLLLFLLIFFSVLYSCQNKSGQVKYSQHNKNKEVSFYTDDSIKIYGDLYEFDKKKPIILLFHQGGSNARGEYNSIIPILTDEGFNVLAIDQRQGGQVYGNYNRTVANISNNNYTYCDAYSDLEAAFNFVLKSEFTGKKIEGALLWGFYPLD